MARPLLVLVSGHPGAGKTTLGRVLGDAMHLPHVNRDRLRDGMWATDPGSIDQARAWQVFLETIRHYLDAGISLVVDQTLYLGMVDDLRELIDHGDVVNVLVRCPNAYERWYEKVIADPRWVAGPDFDAVVERVHRQREEMANPLPLGVPVIEVDTSDGYDPPVAELVRRISDSRS